MVNDILGLIDPSTQLSLSYPPPQPAQISPIYNQTDNQRLWPL